MAKAKTPRPTDAVSNKQVITMPESTATNPAKKLAKPTPTAPVPTPIDLEAQVRQRAYEIYQERGSLSGFDNENWLQAEQEVRARLHRQHSA